jgi:hypothetical protein
MLTLGDIVWTTRLFHTANIGELMADPPVAGAARKRAAVAAADEAPDCAPAQAPHDPAPPADRRLAA